MRKFITTADIHVWIRRDVPLKWQVSRYMQLFESLVGLCKEHDAGLFIAGDLFERADPEQEEIQLVLIFFRMLRDAKIRTWLISGNHETLSEAKDELSQGKDTFHYLDFGIDKTVDVAYGTLPLLSLEQENCIIHFVNHCDLKYYMTQLPTRADLLKHAPLNILVTHVRCNVNQFIREEVDVARLIEPFDLCVAGDIHEALEVEDGKLVYTNHPVNKEFERTPDCGVLLLTIDQGKAGYSRIPLKLPALLQITADASAELPPLNNRDFYRIEVTGTMAELKAVTLKADNVKLIKSPEVAEVLADMPGDEEDEQVQNATLEQELIQYMQTLEYPDPTITDMMDVLREVSCGSA